jgi:hypothetical protein
MIQQAYPTFTDIDGTPLETGYLYIGTAGLNPETSPITVYWDSLQTQPAAQPIRTSGGAPARNGSPAALYGPSIYSLTVRNKKSEIVSTNLNVDNSPDYGTY